jgi:predicted glycosyltransferase
VAHPPKVQRCRRVALYSHDTQGLGHIRRNLAIAGALVAARPSTEVLVVTGAPGAGALDIPPGTDCLSLPALGKQLDGSYRARSLPRPLHALIELRSRIIHAALTSFDPEVVVVDKVPWGICGELRASLNELRRAGRARFVLGLRDVLDSPDVARREWHEDRASEAVASYYDAVWVYGDPRVFDLMAECDLPASVARRSTYTGYLGHGRPAAPAGDVTPPEGPFALCLVGGGQDGLELARAFVQADLPPGWTGLVVSGPYMSAEDRHLLARLASCRPTMVVAGHLSGVEHVIRSARAVVSMAGYNSVCELLAAGHRPLLVPRCHPRAEQLVRAARLARRGVVDLLHPDELSPRQLAHWLASAPERSCPGPVDLDGLSRLPGLLDHLLAAGRGPSLTRDRIHAAS